MSTKKRSRFTSVKPTLLETEIPKTEYADDYMAPLEQLLDEPQQEKKSDPLLADSCKPKNGKRNLQTLMEESREQSMAVPINSANIGFKLLQKIGYKDGEGLGKDGKGMTEPVAVLNRSNKDLSGLGVAEQKQRKAQQIKTFQQVKQTYSHKLESSFIEARITQNNNAQIIRDMKKAQKIIYELDEQSGMEVHELTASLHYRYSCMNKPLLTVTEIDAVSTVRSLHNADTYDRYSGVDIIDTKLEDELVVREEEDGTATTGTGADGGIDSNVCPPDPSLLECLYYLREQYCYCYYCGARYDDTEDLTSNCPGLCEEDH